MFDLQRQTSWMGSLYDQITVNCRSNPSYTQRSYNTNEWNRPYRSITNVYLINDVSADDVVDVNSTRCCEDAVIDGRHRQIAEHRVGGGDVARVVGCNYTIQWLSPVILTCKIEKLRWHHAKWHHVNSMHIWLNVCAYAYMLEVLFLKRIFIPWMEYTS